MANNIVKYNTRVQLKYDTLTEWNKVASTFVPLKGEVCVVNPSEDLGSGSTTALFKVGDGEHTFDKLPYVSALAADVYGWAKLSSENFSELLEKGTLTYDGITYTCTSFATAAALEALAGEVSGIKDIVDDIPDNINDAIDALGNSLANGSGGTLKTITGITYTAATNTATVTYENIQEATASKKGVAKLGATGGAATYERVEELAGNIGSINNKISNAMHFLGITTTPLSDGATTTSLDGIEAEDIEAGAVVIAPYTDKTEKYEFVWTGSAWEMLGQEGSFAVKGSIVDADIAADANIDSDKIKTTLNKTNLTGDITNLNNRLTQAEEDIDDLEGDVASHKSFSKVKAGTTTLEAEVVNDTLNVAAGTAIVVTGTANNDTMTIAHDNVGTGAIAKGDNKELNYEDTFDVIESVTVNAQGHITAYQPRTLKLPKEYDDAPVIALENTAWKTKNIKTTTTEADSTQKGDLAASDLTIGTTEIAYIIFDCGSSIVNV